MSEPRYPNVRVQLVGQDGNAFAILGRTKAAMRRAGVSAKEQEKFVAEATAGDYNHLLRVVMKWVDTV